MRYTRDYKYEQAKAVIDELSDEGRDGLIKYYIEKNAITNKKYLDQIKEYQEVFNMIGKFVPHRGPTVYGS